MPTPTFNSEEIIRLRERVSKLEQEQGKLLVRVSAIASAISISIPAAAALAPSVLHLG